MNTSLTQNRPKPTIIKQGIISSIEEVGSLKIMDFSRCNGLWGDNPVSAMKTAQNWMIGTAAYTVIKIDMSKFPEREDWPGWNHVGNHEPLGRKYWNCFFANGNKGSTLEFSDSPDFRGTFYSPELKRDAKFQGDIGQVSASTFLVDVLPRIHKGDLWITVPNEETQIILEALYNIGGMIQKMMEDSFMPTGAEHERLSATATLLAIPRVLYF